jgi:hypothetical protein
MVEKQSTYSESMEVEEKSQDDPFAEFEVLESEKEFLLSILATAPAEELQALKEIRDAHSTTAAEFYLAPAMRATVEEFARTHPFWHGSDLLDLGKSRDPIDVKLGQFKRDVYEYARAAGMGKNQARVEVMRAVAAWRLESELVDGEVLEEWDEDLESYSDTSCATPILLPGKLITPLASSEAKTPEKSKKRKLDALEEVAAHDFPSQAVELDTAEAKRLRKALKKEKKKAKRNMKKSEMRAQKAVRGVNEQIGQTPMQPLPKSTSTERKAVDEKPAKERKKSKLGPTTSAYFAKPNIPTPNSKSSHLIVGDNDSRPSHARKRARKHQRTATPMESELYSNASVIAPLDVGGHSEQAGPVVVDAVLGLPNEPTSVVKDELSQPKLDRIHQLGEHGPELKRNRNRRKKRRNQNRLPEESPVTVNVQQTEAVSKHYEVVKLHAKKRSPTEAFDENLPIVSDDKRLGSTSEAIEKGGEDLQTKRKRKKSRIRQHTSVEPTVLETSDDALQNPDNTKMVLDDHIAKSTEQPVNSETVQEYETSDPSKTSRRERGRKSKSKHEEDGKVGGDAHMKTYEERAVVEPLTELANTNTKSPKQDRQDRGRGRRRDRDEFLEMHVDARSSTKQSKAYHS